VIFSDGVVNVVPVPSNVPPLLAEYHAEVEEFEVRITVPFPHLAISETDGGGAITSIVAVAVTLADGQPVPASA
jgi:hypothetical protein